MYNNRSSIHDRWAEDLDRKYISMDDRRQYKYDDNPAIEKIQINGTTYNIGSHSP